MTQIIDTIMIFAAGFGTRMGDLTRSTPKPLVNVHGKPILYYVLDSIVNHGFKKIFINSHYLHEQIDAAVRHYQDNRVDCPRITVLYEPDILDTGGTIKADMKYFDSEFIFTHNSDVIIRSNKDLFREMSAAWDANKMDFFLLLHETNKAIGYVGRGDFEQSDRGMLTKPTTSTVNVLPYMYAGIAILKPELIASRSETKFSLQSYYDNPQKTYGYINDGAWCHVSSPKDLVRTEQFLSTYA